jgi:hypothetical protein
MDPVGTLAEDDHHHQATTDADDRADQLQKRPQKKCHICESPKTDDVCPPCVGGVADGPHAVTKVCKSACGRPTSHKARAFGAAVDELTDFPCSKVPPPLISPLVLTGI